MNDADQKVLVSTWLAGVAEAYSGYGPFLRKFALKGYVRQIGWTNRRPRAQIYQITPEGAELAKQISEEIGTETCDVCKQAAFRDLGSSMICIPCGMFVGMCKCMALQRSKGEP